MIKYDRGHQKIWGRQFESGRFILYSPKRGISAPKIVITDYLIEKHLFFELQSKSYVYMMTLRYVIDTYQIRGLFVIK